MTGRSSGGVRISAAIWAAASMASAPVLRFLIHRRLRAGKELNGRTAERRGRAAGPRPEGRLVWIHAASLGELSSILPVVASLVAPVAAVRPASILLTTATASAAGLAAEWIAANRLADAVRHRMVPFDVPRWVRRFLDGWRPDAAVFVESEIWPNTLRVCRERRIPLALVNARLSDRSTRRWSRASGLLRELLGGFDPVWARSAEDRDRLLRFGVRAARVGDLKASAPPLPFDEAALAALSALLEGRPRFLAASTHEGEETLVARVHARLAARVPGLVTIVAPRHPPRGARLAAEFGGVPRRAVGDDPPRSGGIWIADTTGELGLLYRLAPVVFLGRSLGGDGGGQNPWEPARLGCAVLTGPSTRNFREPVARLAAAGGLVIVDDEQALEREVARCLADPEHAATVGRRAREAATAAATDLVGDAARMIAALGNLP